MSKFSLVSALLVAQLLLPAEALSTYTYESNPGFYHQSTFGNWHESNLPENSKKREKLDQVVAEPDVLLITGFADKSIKFDPEQWRTLKDRTPLFYALIRSEKVIGMKRDQVHTLLGKPLQRNRAPVDPESGDIEFYRLTASTKCNLASASIGKGTYLELRYAASKVTGYRGVVWQSGHSQRPGENPFSAK